jgi:segregation and condensation protein A
VSLHVKLQQFEGPLGLLLYLIRKEEMDVFDIPIQTITQQYIEHLRLMRELDLEIAGEFVAMAATLIHIKSRMLLPAYDEDGEIIEEDPRKELVQKILEYEKFQEAAKTLYDRPLLGRHVFKRGTREDIQIEEGDVILDEGGLYALIASYRKAVRSFEKRVHKVYGKGQSIASRLRELSQIMFPGRRYKLSELFEGVEKTRTKLVVTFLSVLELSKLNFVDLFQSEAYADIYIDVQKPITGDEISSIGGYDGERASEKMDALLGEAEKPQTQETQVVQQSIGEPIPEEIASDDDILAAEKELGIGRGEGVNEPEVGDIQFERERRTHEPLAEAEFQVLEGILGANLEAFAVHEEPAQVNVVLTDLNEKALTEESFNHLVGKAEEEIETAEILVENAEVVERPIISEAAEIISAIDTEAVDLPVIANPDEVLAFQAVLQEAMDDEDVEADLASRKTVRARKALEEVSFELEKADFVEDDTPQEDTAAQLPARPSAVVKAPAQSLDEISFELADLDFVEPQQDDAQEVRVLKTGLEDVKSGEKLTDAFNKLEKGIKELEEELSVERNAAVSEQKSVSSEPLAATSKPEADVSEQMTAGSQQPAATSEPQSQLPSLEVDHSAKPEADISEQMTAGSQQPAATSEPQSQLPSLEVDHSAKPEADISEQMTAGSQQPAATSEPQNQLPSLEVAPAIPDKPKSSVFRKLFGWIKNIGRDKKIESAESEQNTSADSQQPVPTSKPDAAIELPAQEVDGLKAQTEKRDELSSAAGAQDDTQAIAKFGEFSETEASSDVKAEKPKAKKSFWSRFRWGRKKKDLEQL